VSYESACTSGYSECTCCGEIIIVDDTDIPEMCDACTLADCPESGDDCQIPQCWECAKGDDGSVSRASLMNDGHWHSNCEEPCPNAGEHWPATPEAIAVANATKGEAS
jgi:hypothetical protein